MMCRLNSNYSITAWTLNNSPMTGKVFFTGDIQTDRQTDIATLWLNRPIQWKLWKLCFVIKKKCGTKIILRLGHWDIKIFTELAHWADSVIESRCPSVCMSVCPLWRRPFLSLERSSSHPLCHPLGAPGCHVSCVMCHVSHVTCHVSHVMCHLSHFFLFFFCFFWKRRWS